MVRKFLQSRTEDTLSLDFDAYRNQAVRPNRARLEVGDHRLQSSDRVQGAHIGTVPVRDILLVARAYRRLTHGECVPQLAALVFIVTHNPRVLDMYFPLLKILNETQIAAFYKLVQDIVQHVGFDLKLIGYRRIDVSAQMLEDVPHLVAGHLAEIFFFRRDILERFLSKPRHIRLYTTPYAFKRDGGDAGGDYNSARESIQLVLSRLFEGFYGETPGVAPFLHELGHMLDHFDAASGEMGRMEGLLPGLSPNDGALFSPHARALFLKGKRIELERYMKYVKRSATPDDALPIGHPYVFQNDTEFAAGYFEMFFRNPHYFAAQNPDLFMAYVELFAYDPREAWKQDFPFYIDQNRDFYLSDQKPWTAGLTIPEA